MIFAFHAAPRPGEWFNDPNGLVFVDGRYRLYVQHSAAAPEFKRIGWGAMSSSDLTDWHWEGVSLPPTDRASVYSGSVTHAAPLEVFFTRHEAGGGPPLQTQWRAASSDGLTFAVDRDALGPAGQNVRDPFVFFWAATGDWRMLLAEPCDWTRWATDPPSIVSVWASDDRQTWRRIGIIGPWDAVGIMWEVPLLLDFGDTQLLLLSVVDRRGGEARSSVRYVPGTFDGAAFVPIAPSRPVDLGPDFYAACVNTVDGWPSEERVMVGWASSWATARTMPWPGGVRGGPIALPRVVRWDGAGLHQAPVAAARLHAAWEDAWQPGDTLHLSVCGDDVRFDASIAPDGLLTASRKGGGSPLDWICDTPVRLTEAAHLTAFIDAGLVELFLDPPGLALTIFVPGGYAIAIRENL